MASSDPPSKFIFNHVGLRVVDLERSVDFYQKAFGMTEITRISLQTSTVVFLAHPSDNHPDPSSVFEREGVLELVASKVILPLHQLGSIGHHLANTIEEADVDRQ